MCVICGRWGVDVEGHPNVRLYVLEGKGVCHVRWTVGRHG